MKISKLFHWLYASVMMLPLFASIVFAIYTRNENSTFNQSVDYKINALVDFNQQFPSDELVHMNTYGVGFNSDSSIICTTLYSSDFARVYKNYVGYQGHKIYLSCEVSSPTLTSCVAFNFSTRVISTSWTRIDDIVNFGANTQWFVGFLPNTPVNSLLYLQNYMFIDLTQMFGVGNEPTIEQFNLLYSDVYYSYNTGTQQLLRDYSSETYNNTDVGSQLIYTLYNSTNNYFNVTNFLGLNNLYDWISINVFNGTPALAFSLFYMLLSYWLLVSIFWLVFDVVMYVPNLAHRWLDKGSLQ